MEKKAVIDITVTPKSSRSTINLEPDNLIRVKLNSPPVDGKANEECIRLFSKALGVPKSAITIVKGERGRQKRLAIEGLSNEDVIARLK